MKILNINRRSVGQVEVALPFDTDEQVSRAFEYLVSRALTEFRYDPEVDGEDADRALIADYLRRRNKGECMDDGPEAADIRRFIPKIWGAELDYDIRELLDVEA
ncbi:hypothetical protein GCM10023063_16550 [Arthrobacter methylotrophus]|uniref:Uncharacterized protein n=1 Tax=Arthrobacter methylotrophus TaxID=121291 RepID=A0ABV5UNH9_9MICC